MSKREWDEECGVFGVYDTESIFEDAARMAYFGLFALQHRGQESAGIAVNQKGRIFCHKEQGLVVEVFNEMLLQTMKGHAAVAHVRYPSSDESGYDSIQPMQIRSRSGHLVISHNGAITNAEDIRNNLKQSGAIFQTSADFEVLLSLLAKDRITTDCIEDAILMMMAEIKGAYSMVIMTDNKLVGVRDPLGIRPLVLGQKGSCYVLASESCALDAVGAKLIRDILPGEVITISGEGVSSHYFVPEAEAQKKGRICIFEFVYFARPDSIIDGASVYESRLNTGKILAKEAPCDCDLVVGAPDSGLAAAMGYALEIGLPYGSALLKNRYVGRTFVQPSQLQREMSVQLKFSVMKRAVEGKRILMVDDSIVRGTTTRHNIAMLREAGATEVHMRVASPPLCYPCFYGVNTPDQKELTAGFSSVEEVRKHIDADSLAYVSLEGLRSSTAGIHCGHCSSCFDGEFPAGVPAKSADHIHRIHW
jgi:amidophosphoribosyltransferase